MRTKKWIQVSDREPFLATKHSGGENQQLKGFDARKRVISGPNGVNRTPDIISGPGKHVPAEKPWKKTPDNYSDPNSSFMGNPVEPKKWTKKGYL